MDLIRNVAAAVMLGDQLEIDARRVTLACLVLDTKVWVANSASVLNS